MRVDKKFKIAAVALALSGIAQASIMVAMADEKSQIRMVEVERIDESKLEKFPAHPSHPLDRPNTLALEYRIETHVSAMATKIGRLNRITKFCGNEDYQEDKLVDALARNLSSNFSEKLVDLARKKYEMARPEKTINCATSKQVIYTLVAEVARHEEVIFNNSIELTVLKEGFVVDAKREDEN